MQSKNRGFTLLEILIVLALIGLIATIILPALKRTNKYAMRDGLQSLTSQVSLAYQSAIFTGRVHRVVFDIKHGRFWTEIAPKDFTGRAPIVSVETESRAKFKESLYNRLEDEAKSAIATDNPLLEIPAHQRNELKDIPWETLKTALIEPKSFTENVIFVKVTTGLAQLPVLYPLSYEPTAETQNEPADQAYLAYVYFFPSATATPASFQVGLRDRAVIDTNAPKYTLNLNTLTGKIKLLEGFQEANFELPK